MSRVAQLDSEELQNELNNIIWADFQSNLQPSRNKDELKLLLDSLVFYFGTHYFKNSAYLVTYPSQLSAVTFRCNKRTLFLVAILTKYLHSKFSTIIFNSNNQVAIKLYKILASIYTGMDLLNLLNFLISASPTSPSFLSPLHRVFGITSKTNANQTPEFYQSSIYEGVQFQNRQLLWNAILELFNLTLFNNTRWFKKPPAEKPTKTIKQGTPTCPHCGNFPVTPYQMTCCNTLFCYICAIAALDWSYCDNCKRTNNLTAKPFY